MIIIGDVHGQYKTLKRLLEKLPEDEICFVGDLVDRGPDSDKVVQLIRGEGYLCVMGNHEQFMFMGAADPEVSQAWYMNGGYNTDMSYNYGNGLKQRESDIEWMKKLPLYLEFKDIKNGDGRNLVVSHSSISTVWDYRNDKRKDIIFGDIMWSRDPVCDVPGIYNVFGHTPQYDEPLVNDFMACIDTGATFNNPRLGKLTALQFPSMKVFQVETDFLLESEKVKKQ